jgi:DNA (cytosine-5)-methyltransferase 1
MSGPIARPVLNYLSCFTGIGGIDLGFDRAGMRCVGQIEIDQHARRVLDHHWPEVPKHDDITTAIDSGWADDIRRAAGRIDVVVGGAPCQDLSIAGKRAGFDGERSVLVLDMVALAAHVGARWLVYENVPGLLTSRGGDDMAVLLHALASAGYSHIEWRVVDSQHFGVPQRRRRVLLVAGTRTPGGRAVLVEPEGGIGNPAPRRQEGGDAAGSPTGGTGAGGGTGAIAVTERESDVLGWRSPLRLSGRVHAEQGPDDAGEATLPCGPHPVAPVVGTLNPGAHPGSYNGQDAYSGLLIPVRLRR